MKHDDAQELVLDYFPQLLFLGLNVVCSRYANDESDEEYDDIIRSITLDLPSLETFALKKAHFVKTCSLICPTLEYLEFWQCRKMATLNFDGGARLKDLYCKSIHSFPRMQRIWKTGCRSWRVYDVTWDHCISFHTISTH